MLVCLTTLPRVHMAETVTFSSTLGITFVFIGKVAKNILRPFFLYFRYLSGVLKKTSVTIGKMFVHLHRISEVRKLVSTLPALSAESPVASQERLHESLWVAPLLCKS